MDDDEFYPIPPFCKGCGTEHMLEKQAFNYCPWCGRELTEIEQRWK